MRNPTRKLCTGRATAVNRGASEPEDDAAIYSEFDGTGFRPGGICSFLTIGSAQYHKFALFGQEGISGSVTIVTGWPVARRLVGEGRPRFSSRSPNPLRYGAKHLRITRTAPNETASGSNAGALSNKEKL